MDFSQELAVYVQDLRLDQAGSQEVQAAKLACWTIWGAPWPMWEKRLIGP